MNFILLTVIEGCLKMGNELSCICMRNTSVCNCNRPEEIEQKELDLLATYLPQALSGDALKTVISEIISENGFSGMQDMGNVMKELKIKHSNAEMSEASSFVKELLS